tara:strand:- start:12068 stop:13660 length:1593 start_codon:yes stop_codon:yes gene_type:complete
VSGKQSQKLGRLGEKEFGILCTQQGATSNESVEDDHGWDHIVEVEPASKLALPADLRDGITRALVQVKSTAGKQRRARVKLSNALKAIQTDLPCFLVLMVFEGIELTEVRVRHFWTNEIKRILKRAREAHRDNRDDLHKIYLEFSMEDLPDVLSNLVEVLCSQVSEHGAKYGREKQSVRENIGYDETRVVGEFTFDGNVTAGDIVDWELSDDAELLLSNFDFKDMRFGIPATKVEQPTAGSKISVGLTPRVGILRLTRGTSCLELDAQLIFPTMVKPDHEAFQVRVKTALFDIRLSPRAEGTINANVDLQIETVWDHHVLAELTNWCDGSPISFQIDCDEGNLFNGHLKPEFTPDEWSKKVSAGGRVAEALVGRQVLQGIPQAHDRIWSQIAWLAQIEMLFGKLSRRLSIPIDTPFDTSCFHIVAFVVFELGDFFHSANLKFRILQNSQDEHHWHLYFDAAQVVHPKKFKTDYSSMLAIAQNEFERLISNPEQGCLSIGTGDIIDIFSTDQERTFVSIHQPQNSDEPTFS